MKNLCLFALLFSAVPTLASHCWRDMLKHAGDPKTPVLKIATAVGVHSEGDSTAFTVSFLGATPFTMDDQWEHVGLAAVPNARVFPLELESHAGNRPKSISVLPSDFPRERFPSGPIALINTFGSLVMHLPKAAVKEGFEARESDTRTTYATNEGEYVGAHHLTIPGEPSLNAVSLVALEKGKIRAYVLSTNYLYYIDFTIDKSFAGYDSSHVITVGNFGGRFVQALSPTVAVIVRDDGQTELVRLHQGKQASSAPLASLSADNLLDFSAICLGPVVPENIEMWAVAQAPAETKTSLWRSYGKAPRFLRFTNPDFPPGEVPVSVAATAFERGVHTPANNLVFTHSSQWTSRVLVGTLKRDTDRSNFSFHVRGLTNFDDHNLSWHEPLWVYHQTEPTLLDLIGRLTKDRNLYLQGSEAVRITRLTHLLRNYILLTSERDKSADLGVERALDIMRYRRLVVHAETGMPAFLAKATGSRSRLTFDKMTLILASLSEEDVDELTALISKPYKLSPLTLKLNRHIRFLSEPRPDWTSKVGEEILINLSVSTIRRAPSVFLAELSAFEGKQNKGVSSQFDELIAFLEQESPTITVWGAWHPGRLSAWLKCRHEDNF